MRGRFFLLGWIWVLALGVSPFHISPARAQNTLIADLGDHLVAITAGFTGANLLLFGAIDQPSDIITVIRGPNIATQIMRKEEVAGIWLNRDRVNVTEVPVFYDIASTKPLEELLSPDILAQYQLGTPYLNFRYDIDRNKVKDFEAALIRLKKTQQLYRDRQSQIVFVGENLFRLNVQLPSSIPPGAYTAEIYSVRDGEIIAAQTTPLIVSKVGLGADIYQFALRHSALYGLTAILVALFMGWLGHLVFRRN